MTTPQYYPIGKVADLADYFDVLFDAIESAAPNEVIISANEKGRKHFGDLFTWHEHGQVKGWRNAYVTGRSPREQAASELALAVATDDPSLRVGMFELHVGDQVFVRKVHPIPCSEEMTRLLSEMLM